MTAIVVVVAAAEDSISYVNAVTVAVDIVGANACAAVAVVVAYTVVIAVTLSFAYNDTVVYVVNIVDVVVDAVIVVSLVCLLLFCLFLLFVLSFSFLLLFLLLLLWLLILLFLLALLVLLPMHKLFLVMLQLLLLCYFFRSFEATIAVCVSVAIVGGSGLIVFSICVFVKVSFSVVAVVAVFATHFSVDAV